MIGPSKCTFCSAGTRPGRSSFCDLHKHQHPDALRADRDRLIRALSLAIGDMEAAWAELGALHPHSESVAGVVRMVGGALKAGADAARMALAGIEESP